MTKNIKKSASSLKIPRIILLTGTFLSFISSKWVTLFAAKIFTSPIKHKIPKREIEMDLKSRQELLEIPIISKKINVYHFGESPKKILLVHGWSGRGTQLVKIADRLVKDGFSTISFDAPAHGKSPGTNTIMMEFIESILFLEKKYGPFEAAIGHSLGGISLLNASRLGLRLNHLIIVGSANVIKDIIDDFVLKLGLQPKISGLLQNHFEKKYKQSMNSFSAYLSAKEIDIPVLVIHDNDDDEVSVKSGIQIHKNLKNAELMITKGLGHRKILGDTDVIEKIIDFIKN